MQFGRALAYCQAEIGLKKEFANSRRWEQVVGFRLKEEAELITMDRSCSATPLMPHDQ
ncbi:hypothetical protein [Nostoc parmelioides]|uniref:hypothetical protein n=1 Tax=Nostoc parmelioides TaxID=1521621 RepID=UPI00168364F8|nr:hypothetical protein [Nostoc parmelioides]